MTWKTRRMMPRKSRKRTTITYAGVKVPPMSVDAVLQKVKAKEPVHAWVGLDGSIYASPDGHHLEMSRSTYKDWIKEHPEEAMPPHIDAFSKKISPRDAERDWLGKRGFVRIMAGDYTWSGNADSLEIQTWTRPTRAQIETIKDLFEGHDWPTTNWELDGTIGNGSFSQFRMDMGKVKMES